MQRAYLGLALGAMLSPLACAALVAFPGIAAETGPDAGGTDATRSESMRCEPGSTCEAQEASAGDGERHDTGSDDAGHDAPSHSEGGAEAGALREAGHDSGIDARTPDDAARVFCGDSGCLIPSEVCCYASQMTGDAASATYACSPAPGNCGMSRGDTAVACDRAADCPEGEVCCGVENTGATPNYYEGVSCKQTCPRDSGVVGIRALTFCAPDASDCPDAQTCDRSTVLVGYHVCN